MRMYGGHTSHRGNTRKNNQDAVFLQCVEQKGEYFALGAVCDGIGGMEQGELASALIIGEIREWFQEVTAWLDISTVNPAVLFAHLKDGAENWNEKLREFCQREDIRTGTTMSLLLIIREHYYIIHVGDSRIYRYHDGLEQLTMDACVATMKNGRVKNYLDNYMGKSGELWFQALEGTVTGGDMFLFCSDGFYHRMTEEDLDAVYRENRKKVDLTESCERMVDTMMTRGERDNISLGIIIMEEKRRWFS